MEPSIRKFCFMILILAWFPTSALAEEWKGIVPGVATRSDIVRLLQKCEDRAMPCQFDLDGERIRIVFSGMVQDYFYECSKKLPTDTVLLIEVTPEVPIPLRDYERRYGLKRLGKTSEFSGYFDEPAGLVLKTKGNKIVQLNYVANSSDRLRCKDYYDDPVKFVTVVTHCPPISLEGPSEAVTGGEIVNFRASVQPDPKMTLIWTVSGGKIVTLSGRQMSLDTSGLDGQTLEVIIQARGSCAVENSMTLQVRPPNATRVPFPGIVPLHSTKNDVVRLLGSPADSNDIRSIYHLENEDVYVVFSNNQHCSFDTTKILIGTVLLVQVHPERSWSLLTFLSIRKD